MKSVKHIITCIMLCTTMPVFYSCSTKDLDYQKACEEGDYTKAWRIVTQLKSEYDKAYASYATSGLGRSSKEEKAISAEKKYEDAYDYVFRSEANFLLTNDDINSTKRFFVLLNESKIDLHMFSHDYPNVIEMGRDYKDYKTNNKNAQYRNDFIKLAKVLDNTYALELFANSVRIEDNDLLEYLIDKNDNESAEKILAMLAKEFSHCKKPDTGLQRDNYLICTTDEYHYAFKAYREFNSKLNKILGLSIGAHNQYLASKLLPIYTETVNVIEGDGDIDKGKIRYKGVKIDRAHIYVDFNNEEKNEAQRRYNEAVKSGVFNH